MRSKGQSALQYRVMNASDITLVVANVILLALLTGIRGINMTPESVTPFELKRRLDEGDTGAAASQTKLNYLPRVIALRHIFDILLSVFISVLSVALLGWLFGGALAVSTLLLSEAVAGRQWLRSASQNMYSTYESRILVRISTWKWLDMLNIELANEDIIVHSKPELIDLISRSHGVLSKDEQQHIHNALLFSGVLVQDIMTPRSMIDSIDQREAIGPLVMDQLHKTGHSRFPVIDGDIDHVTGMLYLHDLITLNSGHKTVKGAMQTNVYYVRQDHDLEHALHAFLRTHHHLFIVINEFRETVGLLSLEDVIEYLLGKQVVDEFDEYDNIRKVAESNPRKSNEPKGKINL